jgi:hypothetical protein
MDEKTASGESEEATGTGRPTNSKVLSAGGNVFCIQPSFDPRKIEACIEAKVLTKQSPGVADAYFLVELTQTLGPEPALEWYPYLYVEIRTLPSGHTSQRTTPL